MKSQRHEKTFRLVILETDGPAEAEIYRDTLTPRIDWTRPQALERLLEAALWKFREPRKNGGRIIHHLHD